MTQSPEAVRFEMALAALKAAEQVQSAAYAARRGTKPVKEFTRAEKIALSQPDPEPVRHLWARLAGEVQEAARLRLIAETGSAIPSLNNPPAWLQGFQYSY